MEEKIQSKIGESNYVNKNCWMASTLGYPLLKRCWYCQLKLQNCPFFRFILTSIVLIIFTLVVVFLLEHSIPKSIITSLFILVPVYAYLFHKNTEALIVSNFAQMKGKKELERAKATLESTVAKRTKELRELTKSLDQQVKEKTKELQKSKAELEIRVTELEKFRKLTVGREMKMIEFKKEMERLKKELEKKKK